MPAPENPAQARHAIAADRPRSRALRAVWGDVRGEESWFLFCALLGLLIGALLIGVFTGLGFARVSAPPPAPARIVREYVPCLPPSEARSWSGSVLDAHPPACPPERTSASDPVVARTSRGVRLLWWDDRGATWREVGDSMPRPFEGTVWWWERP